MSCRLVRVFSPTRCLGTSVAERRYALVWRALVVLALTGYHAVTPALIVDVDPDWKETDVPAPPAFNHDKLLPLEMPPYVSLQFGIDPATLVVTPDGIVRYVVVARTTSGSVTAFYEGIRCATAQFKTYARANNEGVWTQPGAAVWRDLNANVPSKHAIVFARQAACDGATAASSVADIVRALKK